LLAFTFEVMIESDSWRFYYLTVTEIKVFGSGEYGRKSED